MSGLTWKLLIIADHAGLRSELRRMLEHGSERRYELVEAETGAAGVRCLNAGDAAPDCVLLAHEPPSLDALEVLAALRAARPVPPCPVVILPVTVVDGRELERAALRAGAMECVERSSLNAQALTRAVENAIDRFAPWRTMRGFARGTDSQSTAQAAVEHTESSRAQLEAVINAMADGVVVFDMARNVVLLNEAEARISGFANAAEMKRDLAFFAEFYELSFDDGRPLPVEEWPISRVLRGETITYWRLRARRRDTGQEWHIDFSGAPVRDEAGRQVLAIIITRDITNHVRAEQALRESEARAHHAAAKAEAESRLLDAVLEAVPAGIIVADASGKLVRMNPANERLWGTAPRSGSVDECREWKGWWADGSERHGRRLEPREWAMARALRGDITPGDIVEIEPFDAPGTRRTMLNSAAPVRDAAGRILGGVVAQMDITARVEAEAAVRRIEERHRLVSRATNDVIWDWDLETNRLEWNEAVLAHFGCTREELGPTVDAWYSRIHPEDRDRVVAGIHAAIDGGQEGWTDEYRFRRSDGSYAAFLDRGYIGRDASGRAVRMIGWMLDLTERRRAEAALRESKERFEALADNISQLAWMADETGWIFWYNQRWFDYTGTTFDEMKGWGWQKVHHPDHLQRVVERFTRHLATGEVWEDTFPLRSKTGEYRWFLSRARPIRDDTGQVRRWFGTNTDITAQLEAEAKLKEALRARDEFLSIASHELKTPLTSLKLQLQMMQRRTERGDQRAYEPERVGKLVEQSNRQLARLARLVDDMLDIARIQTGRLVIEPRRVDAVELTREVLERLSPHLAEAGTPATLEVPERLEAEWDRFRIEQVVTNLLTNAMRYGDHKPVDVKLRSQDGRILLSVRDQGLGIAKESQERIFNRFERAISASDVSGLGLGLFISRQIVEAHGGRIWVESEGPGRGATFFVELLAFPDFNRLKQAELQTAAFEPHQAWRLGLQRRGTTLVNQ
ncbi:PAS domain S-box protein [Archangium sp.]|uniref:hybrid sensor histidine kinase/response regulator n=1 Tax=Archangium sp. TaxID=1872627 RepID=UPI002D6EB16C|nr:PAS domain S-box protein [Archangium sp.]HYO54995.1 PAS domain S-box protein [Archangium sp.]